MSPWKQALGWLVAHAVGLYVTWRVATWLAWRREGLDRDAAEGSADCDDCGVTVLLDQIGVVLACFAGYFLLVGCASFLWRQWRGTGGGIVPGDG